MESKENFRSNLLEHDLVKRLLRNPNWKPAALAAVAFLIDGKKCPVLSWAKSSSWAQVQVAYEELSRQPGRIHDDQREAFPIIDRDRFQRHPKYRKPLDRARMLYSKASEDWVTWTVFRLLERYARTTWWSDLVKLARTKNRQLKLPRGWKKKPSVELWESVPSPRGYETPSRDRMRRSNNEDWVKRGMTPGRSRVSRK